MPSFWKLIIVALFTFYHPSSTEDKKCPHKINQGGPKPTCQCDSQSESCNLICNGVKTGKNYQCYDDNLKCTDNYDCTIYCNGYEACEKSTITCPQSANCTVQCDTGSDVCLDLNIDENGATSFKCIGNCPSEYSSQPTSSPTPEPINPTSNPAPRPTPSPTHIPTKYPSKSPTERTASPTHNPSVHPTTRSPTPSPTRHPTSSPTPAPATFPTPTPTPAPTTHPTPAPTTFPTEYPTTDPTKSPTKYPTISPTTPSPTLILNSNPTFSPTHLEEKINTEYSSTLEKQEIGGTKDYEDKNRILTVVVFILGIALTCVCCALLYIIKKRRNKKSNYNEDVNKLKMTQIELNTTGYVPPNIVSNTTKENDKDIDSVHERDTDIVKAIDKTKDINDNERDMEIVKEIDKTAMGVSNDTSVTDGNISTTNDEISDDSEDVGNTVGETDY